MKSEKYYQSLREKESQWRKGLISFEEYKRLTLEIVINYHLRKWQRGLESV